MTVRRLRGFGSVLTLALAASVVPVGEVVARPPRWEPPVPDDVTPVEGVKAATWRPQPTWSADAARVRGDSDVVWPEARTATVALASTPGTAEARGSRAGDTPVWVAPVAEDPAASVAAPVEAAVPPRKVEVEVHGRPAAVKAGVFGVVLSVGRADGVKAAAQSAVSVDYGAFAAAGGGDWASRLRLVQLPACALTTPDKTGCATATPLPSRNDIASRTVTATAPLAAEGTTVLALTAAPEGDNGDYKATSLSPASTWDVSTQTGAFTWSLPMRTVPVPGGPAPGLELAYSSQTMDGRTSGNNTQGSWAGDGFDLWPGYIERTSIACSEDTGAVGGKEPNNKGKPTGDQCWWKPNATLSLNGRSTELVDVGGGLWKGVSDDGSKVERLTGAANGDDDGEHWKVTTVDGMQYFFGRGGGSSSTWTTPVYGNHPGDPGYAAGSFASSRRTQGWRWNLDYVVDPHGNTMRLFYEKEGGAYGRENDPNKRTTYDRGGYLTRIEHGGRTDGTPAAARVVFDVEDRCKPGATCLDGNGRPIPASFPDTPLDQYCHAVPCTDQLHPTYWTQKRLARVRTQVRSGSDYSDVESWTLRHEWLDAGVIKGEGIPMFLRGVTRTGHVGTDVSDPEIVFDPGSEPLPNRVDGPADNRTALNRWRIKRVTTETGAQVLVDYKPAQCTRSTLPPVHANGKLCFPQYYAPKGEAPTLDWFHKYVVAKITANDNAAGSTSQETHYDYLDAPAWHFDDSELVKEAKRTWSGFRGFGHVRVRKGFDTEVQLTTEQRFLRGMDGDKQPSGVRDVWVTDSWGNRIEDHEAYAGRTLEAATFDGNTGPWVQGTVTTPTTPIRTGASGALEAWMVNSGTSRSYSRTTVEPDGVRWTRTETRYNADNLPYEVDDLGDETTAADDRCTRTWFARNPGIHMLDKVKRTETVGVACSVTPSFPDDMVSSSRVTYDDVDGNWDTTLPTRGLPAKVEELDRWEGTSPQWVTTGTSRYDDVGRVVSSSDALGRTTTTEHTPLVAGPVTRIEVTNPLGHATSTELATAWGLPRQVTNANDVATELTYDGLGRLAKVWLDGRATSATPNLAFEYLVRNTAPTAVTARKLLPSGTGTATEITLYDGWARERQVQTQAPGGGRTLTETHYNSRAEKWWTSAPYFDLSGPGPDTTLVAASRSKIPSVTEYGYDGAGRPTVEALHSTSGERWRTVTSYAGDLTTVTPPEGGTRTATRSDARGQTVETRRYHARTGPSGFDATTYTFTDGGQISTVTDPAGNIWRHFYDQRGREIRNEDPDKGVTRTGYDAAGQVVSATDAAGMTLATTYDELGRRETLRDGDDDGPVRARWFYDSLAYGTGRLTRSVRYDGGRSYVKEITGYDKAGNPTGVSVTIPSSEGALCAAGGTSPCTFRTTMTYKADGQISTSTLPRLGDLAAEQLTQNYNDVGAPTTITSSSGALMRSVHYDKTGRVTQRVLGALGKQVASGVTLDDTTGRVTEASVALENRPSPMALAYGYDAVGNVERIHDTPHGQAADTQCYRYDHHRRLTEAWTPGSGDCGPAPAVAALGGPAAYWHSFEYAGAAGLTGSRSKETWHAAGGDTTRTYTYPAQAGPAGSRPHALTKVATDNPSGADTVDTYTYDASGNTDTRSLGGAASDLDWNVEGHLAKVTGADGKETRYIYDADGGRLLRRDPDSGTTLYLPDGQQVTVAPGASTATGTRQYQHSGVPIGVRTKAGLSFVVGDHHNTGEVAVKSSDLSVTRRRTTPFGTPRGTATAGTWPDDRGFVGGTKDVDGLVQLGARLYEPTTGRFVSVDPLIDQGDAQQMHGYAYGNNAPPTYTDPNGLMRTVDDIGGGGGGGGGGAATGCRGTPDRCADQRGLNNVPPAKPRCSGTPDRCADLAGLNKPIPRNPVLFLHGYNSDSSIWTTMMKRFEAAGYSSNELYAISYCSCDRNEIIAENDVKRAVEELLARTGAAKVDIVSHSMGGLNSRYYIKNLGGDAYVDDHVGIGTPNHGAVPASWCVWGTTCEQLRAGSLFLNRLNEGDETPGNVTYYTFWSGHDYVARPESVALDGAINVDIGTKGGHRELYTDDKLIDMVISAVG